MSLWLHINVGNEWITWSTVEYMNNSIPFLILVFEWIFATFSYADQPAGGNCPAFFLFIYVNRSAMCMRIKRRFVPFDLIIFILCTQNASTGKSKYKHFSQ